MEEIETGLHPTRLHLLVQLIEHSVAAGNLQVVGTTHSPQLLTKLSDRSRENAHLIYRLEGTTEGRIRRIVDIPEARRLLMKQGLARLHGKKGLGSLFGVQLEEKTPDPFFSSQTGVSDAHAIYSERRQTCLEP